MGFLKFFAQAKPRDIARIFCYTFAIFVGFAYSLSTHSIEPLKFFILFIVGMAIFSKSLEGLFETIRNNSEWSATDYFYFTVLLSIIAVLIMGALSLAEKIIWNSSSIPPSFTVSKQYGNSYTANDHRLFKAVCEANNIKGFVEVKETSDKVYLRCGSWFPHVFTLSANKDSYDQAVKETANDDPNEPIVIPYGTR